MRLSMLSSMHFSTHFSRAASQTTITADFSNSSAQALERAAGIASESTSKQDSARG
jgi:hypothetical protein